MPKVRRFVRFVFFAKHLVNSPKYNRLGLLFLLLIVISKNNNSSANNI